MEQVQSEIAEFAGRVGLAGVDAAYLHDAVRFFMAAKSAISYEQRFCEIYDKELSALHLMLAAVAAKYRLDVSGHVGGFHQMAGAVETMTDTIESCMDDVAEAIREGAAADRQSIQEMIEVGRALADHCQCIDNSIEALRKAVDTYGDVIYKQAATKSRER